MLYGARALGVRRYVAKIRDTNQPSIRLFESLRYREVPVSACFWLLFVLLTPWGVDTARGCVQ